MNVDKQMTTTSVSTSTSVSVSTAVASVSSVAGLTQSAFGVASTSVLAAGSFASAGTAVQGLSTSVQQTPLARGAVDVGQKPSFLSGAQAQQGVSGIQSPIYSGTPGGDGLGQFPSTYFSPFAGPISQFKETQTATATSLRTRPSRPIAIEVPNEQVHDVDGFGFAFVSENTGTIYRYRTRNRDYYKTFLKRPYRQYLANEGDDDL